MHALGTSMYAKWKEEMQTYSQLEMAAQLKAELVPLEGKIHAFMAKDVLKLVQEGLKVQGKAMKEACKQEVSIAVDNEIQKSKEAIAAMEASVSKVQENVEKNVHTWAEMAKDAVDKEAAMYDTRDKMLRELDPCDLYMHRMAQDARDVTDYGPTFAPKIVDFGLSRLLNDSVARAKGAFGYAPPEDTKGEAFTKESDVFSLGILLELISGKNPSEKIQKETDKLSIVY
ncbi:hypothetical protein L7F22_042469 [Adiantum nelumboides]|nr:hypothetical protein [Adiantum nelumboides]